MRKSTVIAIFFGLTLMIGATQVSAGNGSMFGGIFNFFQWQRDADDDGIPNGQDGDYIRPQDGTGFKSMFGFGSGNEAASGEGEGDGVQNEYNHRYIYRYNQVEGDMLRDQDRLGDKTRLRIRDGSCDD